MRRRLAIPFLCALLWAFLAVILPRAAAAAPAPPLEDVLQDVATLIDVQIQAIPVPAVTREDKEALKAWKAAARSVDQAIANPSPTRVAGIVGSLDKDLVSAFGAIPAVTAILDELTQGLLNTTARVLADLRAEVADLPPGRGTDGLLAKLDTADALLADARGPVTRARARTLAVKALRIASDVEKLRRLQAKRLVALKGLSATADGVAFSVRDITVGNVVKDSITGEPLSIVIVWEVTSRGVTHHVSFQIIPTHMPGDPPEGVPTRTLALGTHRVSDGYIAANYEKRIENGGTEQIDAVTGSFTLHALDTNDPKASAPGFGYASVSGWFTFSGHETAGPGSALTVTGRFNVGKHPKGLVVIPPAPPPDLKTSDR